LDYLQNSTTALEEKVETLTANRDKIIQDYEKRITSFKTFKQQAFDLKNTLDKMIIKMSSIKGHFQKSHQEKSELLQERHDLVIRAAAGFENLTPRPNFTQLCKDKNLNLGNLLPKTEKKKKLTTVFVVDNFLNKICEYQAKVALMDAELKDRRKQAGTPQSQQSANIRKVSMSQNNPKTSRVGGSISPNKASRMLNLELEKKSKFVTLNTDEDLKSLKDSNLESPQKFGTFDFKLELKKEEEENMEITTGREREEVKETENIIMDIIESKKMIEQFDISKLELE